MNEITLQLCVQVAEALTRTHKSAHKNMALMISAVAAAAVLLFAAPVVDAHGWLQTPLPRQLCNGEEVRHAPLRTPQFPGSIRTFFLQSTGPTNEEFTQFPPSFQLAASLLTTRCRAAKIEGCCLWR